MTLPSHIIRRYRVNVSILVLLEWSSEDRGLLGLPYLPGVSILVLLEWSSEA